MTVGAAVTFARGWSPAWVFLAAVAGSALGASATWAFGRWLAGRSTHTVHPRVARLRDEVLRATRPLDRHGLGLVVACRFMPAVRAVVVVAAGFRAMPFARVLAAATVGAALWDAALFTLAFLVGRNLPRLAVWLDAYSRVAGAVLVAAVVVVGLRWWWRQREA